MGLASDKVCVCSRLTTKLGVNNSWSGQLFKAISGTQQQPLKGSSLSSVSYQPLQAQPWDWLTDWRIQRTRCGVCAAGPHRVGRRSRSVNHGSSGSTHHYLSCWWLVLDRLLLLLPLLAATTPDTSSFQHWQDNRHVAFYNLLLLWKTYDQHTTRNLLTNRFRFRLFWVHSSSLFDRAASSRA